MGVVLAALVDNTAVRRDCTAKSSGAVSKAGWLWKKGFLPGLLGIAHEIAHALVGEGFRFNPEHEDQHTRDWHCGSVAGPQFAAETQGKERRVHREHPASRCLRIVGSCADLEE